MPKRSNIIHRVLVSLRVGFFLAMRQVRRASAWTNVLVVCIMTLTFLNLIVVSGILVGLVEGVGEAIQEHYLGDVFISTLKQHSYIDNSQGIISFAGNIPGVRAVTARYLEQGTVESDYKEQKKPGESAKVVGTSIARGRPS